MVDFPQYKDFSVLKLIEMFFDDLFETIVNESNTTPY